MLLSGGEDFEDMVALGAERLKFQSYAGMLSYNYFWRTYDQQEIDWIEERGASLYAYELKWRPKRTADAPIAWRNAYPDAYFELIHPDNLYPWVALEPPNPPTDQP
jgi:hypothetical protein